MKTDKNEFFNIEIKAKCNEHDFYRKLLKEKHAEYKGIDVQTDTYFNINFGRLKLREGTIENALIFYDRKNDAGPKRSNVILYNSSDYINLKQILVQSSGVLIKLEKKREIYFIDNVKFHLDTIKELGTFIEIEAIRTDEKNSTEILREQCDRYIELFKIKEEDMIAHSYSDLLLNKQLRI